MLKIVGIVVVLLIGAVLAFAAMRPDTFRVHRSTTIKAPPEKIFPLISDFKRWGAWSPYEKKDPDMKRSFGGAAEGKGSVYAWDGDGNVGQGRMEITDAAAPPRWRSSSISRGHSRRITGSFSASCRTAKRPK
jgi:hypothetical protein